MSDPTNTERLDAVIRMTAERMRSGATPIVSIYNALVDLRDHLATPPPSERREPDWYIVIDPDLNRSVAIDREYAEKVAAVTGWRVVPAYRSAPPGMDDAVREALHKADLAIADRRDSEMVVLAGLVDDLTRALKATEGER